MAAVLSPSVHTHQQTYIASPPADSHRPLLSSSHIKSRPSIKRSSWSSDFSTPALSPTSPNTTKTPAPRKLRLPVRVSTDSTSFVSSDSSPQSRRRSLSLASDNSSSKRRTSQIPSLKKAEEASRKVSDDKSATSKSPASDSKPDPPPPSYQDAKVAVADSKETGPSPPSYQDTKRSTSSQDTKPPPPKYPAASSPVKETAVKDTPAKETPAPAPSQVSQPISQEKMSSVSSSPEAQKSQTAGNPNTNRGMDFSVGNGNNRLTHQSEGLPLPGLSGRPNGAVGNLLRGPVDDHGNLKAAALTVGIKLDLEAEVHVSARVRGDILVGLY